jgi:opacity protein-like surface antigen
MRRVSFLPSIAALVSAGCATNPAPVQPLPELSVASLSAPNALAASGWSELELAAPATQLQERSHDAATSSPGNRHVTLMVGERSLDGDDWGPFDSPSVYGVEFDETSPGSGNGFEAGLFYTNDQDDDVAAAIAGEVEVTTYEFYGGVRHTFRPGQGGLHPFVSAGLDLEHGRIKLTAPGVSEADGDLVAGAYARAGLLWDITDRVRLGVDYRYLIAQDFEIFDTSLGTDYDQVTFSLGFAF